MQIGDLAERAGVSTRTIRYYEELGLVDPMERTHGGRGVPSNPGMEGA